ncbi:MAG: cell division protein ZapB [Rhodocyclaceae bacterium]|nr:cell division protein ZapB [Rhodocyclaceae bacterium]
MSQELDSLEQKIDRLVAVGRGLRAENEHLRGRIEHLEREKQALTDRIEQARGRLEALMDRLPE